MNRFPAFVLVKIVNCRSEFPEMIKVIMCIRYNCVNCPVSLKVLIFFVHKQTNKHPTDTPITLPLVRTSAHGVKMSCVRLLLPTSRHDLASQYRHYQMQYCTHYISVTYNSHYIMMTSFTSNDELCKNVVSMIIGSPVSGRASICKVCRLQVNSILDQQLTGF